MGRIPQSAIRHIWSRLPSSDCVAVWSSAAETFELLPNPPGDEINTAIQLGYTNNLRLRRDSNSHPLIEDWQHIRLFQYLWITDDDQDDDDVHEETEDADEDQIGGSRLVGPDGHQELQLFDRSVCCVTDLHLIDVRRSVIGQPITLILPPLLHLFFEHVHDKSEQPDSISSLVGLVSADVGHLIQNIDEATSGQRWLTGQPRGSRMSVAIVSDPQSIRSDAILSERLAK